MTYLKYADLCATHLRNALKEPARTKAKQASDMHVRITQFAEGKRGKPGAPIPRRAPCIFSRLQSRLRRPCCKGVLHRDAVQLEMGATAVTSPLTPPPPPPPFAEIVEKLANSS